MPIKYMDFLKKSLKELVSKFEIAEKNEELTLGKFDYEVKKFSVQILDFLISNHSNEKKYFEGLKILNEFLEIFVFARDGNLWSVWTNIDFEPLNEISFGSLESLDCLVKTREKYFY
jgi:hypothetical protein